MARKKTTSPSPFAISDSIKAAEMPLFREIVAWLCVEYSIDKDVAEKLATEAHGKVPAIEPYQWKAKVHLLVERRLFAQSGNRGTHWMDGVGAQAFLNFVHSEFDQRRVIGLPGRREAVKKALGVEQSLFQHTGSASEAREAFAQYLIDENFPLKPELLKETESKDSPTPDPADKPEGSELDKWFPREDEPQPNLPKNNWPQLIPDKWYGLDIKNRVIVNQPFNTERACYLVYPKIRQQDGEGIQKYIGTHYELVEPSAYTMPDYDGRNGQPIPAPGEDEMAAKTTTTAHWIKDDKQRVDWWKRANKWCNKHKVTTNAKDRGQIIHDILGIEKMEEYEGTIDQAEQELKVGLEELFPLDDENTQEDSGNAEPKKQPDPTPDEIVKQLWAELLPQVKELRSDVTDKNAACESVLKVLGHKSMMEAYTALGSDGVRKWWTEHKQELVESKPPAKKSDEPASNGASKPTDLSPNTSSNETVADPPEIQLPPVDTSRQIALVQNTSLLPTTSEWQFMREMAQSAIKSGLMPKGINTPDAALLIIETGRELGIPPTLALRNIQIIQGQPTLAAELMLALVKRSGQLEYISIEGDHTQCTVTMRRKGVSSYVETFTIDMARKMMTTEYENGQPKRIPLADKFNWRTMPKTMLKWRAVSACCRTVFPDITMGIYTSEEMSDNLVLNGHDYVEAEIAA